MGHTHRYRLAFKKKNQVKSPSPESRVPETGSDPPIESDRDSGCDRLGFEDLSVSEYRVGQKMYPTLLAR